jgi:uncharacterized protein (DUF58 family)
LPYSQDCILPLAVVEGSNFPYRLYKAGTAVLIALVLICLLTNSDLQLVALELETRINSVQMGEEVGGTVSRKVRRGVDLWKATRT